MIEDDRDSESDGEAITPWQQLLDELGLNPAILVGARLDLTDKMTGRRIGFIHEMNKGRSFKARCTCDGHGAGGNCLSWVQPRKCKVDAAKFWEDVVRWIAAGRSSSAVEHLTSSRELKRKYGMAV